MAHLLDKKKPGKATVTYEFHHMDMKPPNQSCWEGFAFFIYDPRTKKIFTRTVKSWGQLFIFYSVYFAILFSMFAICMDQLMRTINREYPKYQLNDSLIGAEPGIAFRPIATSMKDVSLVTYNPKNPESVSYWTSKIDEFLEPYYENVKSGVIPNLQTCDFATPPKRGKVCAFEPTSFGPCNKIHGYGYNRTSPCIFIKLNKIYGWLPDLYNDITDLPEEMPDELVQHIKSRPEKERNQVWVNCKGMEEVDSENFNSELDYFPTRGFPSYYYPYTNARGYMSPVVAVQLKNITKGVIVNIECRAWARNINYKEGIVWRQGSTIIQVMIE